MPRRRRATVVAIALACGTLALSACSGDSDATDGTSTSTSTSSGSGTSTDSGPLTGPSSTSPGATSTDPYEIDCTRVPQEVVTRWSGGEPTDLEPTDEGCRYVSSHEAGAVMVEWRYLDIAESSGDAGIVRDNDRIGVRSDLAPGVTGTRTESDVEPTRTSRVVAPIGDRTLFVQTTVTLDRKHTLEDMRRITTSVLEAYAGDRSAP